jgi:hypothetical protein
MNKMLTGLRQNGITGRANALCAIGLFVLLSLCLGAIGWICINLWTGFWIPLAIASLYVLRKHSEKFERFVCYIIPVVIVWIELTGTTGFFVVFGIVGVCTTFVLGMAVVFFILNTFGG